jgi:hypothetical protein
MMLTLDNVADAAVPVTMEKWVAAVNDGSHEQVSPGKPYRIPDAVSLGDTVWQGDVGIVVCGLPGEGIPAAGDIGSFEYLGEKYTQCSPQAKAAKLVPGNEDTEGARHILDAFDGVIYCRPEAANRFMSSTAMVRGPILVCQKDRTIQHPKHGDVTIPAGMSVAIIYQRELDPRTGEERRAAD